MIWFFNFDLYRFSLYIKRHELPHDKPNYENMPVQIYWKFNDQKIKKKKSDKKFWYFFFYISAQNIDCGYLLVPPRRGGSNEYPQCFEQK